MFAESYASIMICPGLETLLALGHTLSDLLAPIAYLKVSVFPFMFSDEQTEHQFPIKPMVASSSITRFRFEPFLTIAG